MIRSHVLPTLQEASKRGWTVALSPNRDLWRDADRSRLSLTAPSRLIRAVKYGRIGVDRRGVLANHGGPLGKANEMWRYLVDPNLSDLLLPDRIGGDRDRGLLGSSNTDTIIADVERLHRACLGIPALVTGSSWGATVSLVYASRFPDFVTGLVVSCPLVPTNRSLDFMVAKDGGFEGSPDLHDMFIEPVRSLRDGSAREIFRAYRSLLTDAAVSRQIVRSFSALLYASSGDFPIGLSDHDIPRRGISRGHALALAYFAMQPRPFFIDMPQVLRGLNRVRDRRLPVHVIVSADDRSSHPSDLDQLFEATGAVVVRTTGGHSSATSKAAIASAMRALGV